MADTKLSDLTLKTGNMVASDLVEITEGGDTTKSVTGTKITDMVTSGSVVTANTAKISYPSSASTKLAGIEDSATADQTNDEIKAAVEAASDSNTFTDADHTKLNAVEASATADQTDAEIRTAVEAASDSNVFTDADHNKLNSVATSANNYVHPNHSGDVVSTADGATVIQTDAVDIPMLSATGTASSTTFLRGDNTWGVPIGGVTSVNSITGAISAANIAAAVEAASGSNTFTDADHSKLNAIEALADVTDSTNVVAALTAGTGITIASNGTIAAGPLAVTTVQVASSQSAQLALTAQEGDVVVRSDEDKSYMHNGGTAGTMDDYTLLATPTDAVLSVNGVTGAVTAAHIATAVEAASGSNTFTDADHTKLNAIETSATADQSAAEIKTLLENGIDSVHYVDGSIDTVHIGDDQVTADKLANSINSAIAANTAKTGITSGQTSAIVANTAKTGITSGQASAITANTAKTGITSGQASAITANTAKTGITSGQASAITANTAKVTNATHSGEVTGATALTIANNVVDEANLKVSNTPTNGYALTAQSGNTGGLTWAEMSGGGGYTASSSAPSSPADGEHWFDTSTGTIYFRVGSNWVDVSTVSPSSEDTLADVLAVSNTTAGAGKIEFRDAALFINSSTDGQLDIAADVELQIVAPTIDINGAVDVSGEIIAASLDISGDVDVDGTLEADAITLNGAALGLIYSPIAGGSGIVNTGAINSGSITSGFGTIDNGSSSITTTGTLSSGALTATTGNFTGAFTSLGIDDNATAEVLQLSDTEVLVRKPLELLQGQATIFTNGSMVISADDNGGAGNMAFKVNALPSLTLNNNNSATFAGDVTISGGNVGVGTAASTRAIDVLSATNDTLGSGVRAKNSNNGTAASANFTVVSASSSGGLLAYPSNSTVSDYADRIVLKTNSDAAGLTLSTGVAGGDIVLRTASDTTALTLDSSQNATFAGDIMTGVTSLPSAGEAGTYLAAAGYTYSSRAGTTKAPHFLMTNNNGTAGSLSSSGTGELLISSGTGNTTALTLDNSQNATFAGDVTLGTSSEMVMSRLDGLLVMGTATKPSAQISSSETMLYIEDTSACVIGMNNTGASGENWRLFTDTSGNFRINNQANGNLVTVGATGDATFAGAVTANNTITTIAPDTDHTSFEQIASTTTGAVRQLFKNSNNSKNFELSGFFSSGTEQLAVQSKTNTIARFHHGGSTTFEGDVDMVAGKYLNTGGGSASYHQLYASAISGVGTITATIGGTHGGCVFFNSSSYGANAANTVLVVQKVGATGRSINAGGTINASGADFAEYRELIPALYNNTSAGDLLGYNSEGLLTNVFADVTGRFCIKSTSPAYVGNDIWGNENAIGELPEEPVQDEDTTDEAFADLMVQYELDKEAHALVLEAARVKVDRIAIAGIVPANVTGITVADVGTYLVPTSNEDGTIGAIAIDEDNLTLKQYIKSFGAVERINGDVVMAAVKTC